jgi:hypothetical protein
MARKWWTLTAVVAGMFMLLLDVTIVNVALPQIQRRSARHVRRRTAIFTAGSLLCGLAAGPPDLALSRCSQPRGLGRSQRNGRVLRRPGHTSSAWRTRVSPWAIR